jgi:acetoacetate decarboxylase
LAPVADLPVLEVVSAIHILADLTLGLGKVVHDYLLQHGNRQATYQIDGAGNIMPRSEAVSAA